MALARKITPVEYETLHANVKEHYIVDGDSIQLETSGDEDTGALIRAKDHEKRKRHEAQTKVAKLESDIVDLQEKLAAGAGKPGDVEALKTSYETKLATLKKELNATITGRDEFIKKTLVDSAAGRIAAEISTAPSILSIPIKARLSVDFTGEEPTLVILGADGKPSATNLDDLKKEFQGNKEYAAIITGSKATGSGATGAGRGGSAGGGAVKKFAEMNDAERTQYSKDDPTGFAKAAADSRSAMFGH